MPKFKHLQFEINHDASTEEWPPLKGLNTNPSATVLKLANTAYWNRKSLWPDTGCRDLVNNAWFFFGRFQFRISRLCLKAYCKCIRVFQRFTETDNYFKVNIWKRPVWVTAAGFDLFVLLKASSLNVNWYCTSLYFRSLSWLLFTALLNCDKRLVDK
jgi:hypothetical protein